MHDLLSLLSIFFVLQMCMYMVSKHGVNAQQQVKIEEHGSTLFGYIVACKIFILTLQQQFINNKYLLAYLFL